MVSRFGNLTISQQSWVNFLRGFAFVPVRAPPPLWSFTMSNYLPNMRVGDDYSIKLIVQNPDKTPQNITGFKFWLTLKTSFALDDAAATLQFITTVGHNPNDNAAAGECYIYIDGEQTKTIPAGSYYYDIQQKTLDGGITTIVPPIEDYKDKITVVPEVTRAIA